MYKLEKTREEFEEFLEEQEATLLSYSKGDCLCVSLKAESVPTVLAAVVDSHEDRSSASTVEIISMIDASLNPSTSGNCELEFSHLEFEEGESEEEDHYEEQPELDEFGNVIDDLGLEEED